jgi:hypothetical protein
MLLLKLLVVPVLIAGMSLAARRFGPTVGGLLIGLPWMTGPVVFLLGLDKGDAFAASVATGTLLATVSIAAYALVFGVLARRFRWPVSLTAGAAAYAATGWALSGVDIAVSPAALIGGGCLLAASALIPAPAGLRPAQSLPWWDIPVRMLAAFVLVVVIALVSDRLSPTASGIVASFPVLLTVIGTFTHHQWGADALRALLRGITQSLLSFVAFFWVVGTGAVGLGLVRAYVVATLAAVAASAAMIALNRRRVTRVKVAAG